MLDNLEKNWEWTKFQTLSLRFDGWNVGRDGVTLWDIFEMRELEKFPFATEKEFFEYRRGGMTRSYNITVNCGIKVVRSY